MIWDAIDTHSRIFPQNYYNELIVADYFIADKSLFNTVGRCFSKLPLEDSIILDRAVTAASFSIIVPSSINLNNPWSRFSRWGEIVSSFIDSAKFIIAAAAWARTRGILS